MEKILTTLILVLFPAILWAAAPVVFFSDMPDGPTTGWPNDDIATKGAAVSIWGLNFGSSGSVVVKNVTGTASTVTIASTSCAEWAATTNPTTARGLQRTTFYLSSGMNTDGTGPNSTIEVITSEGTSNAITFHCRALGTNHIYFFSTSGSDSNAGTIAAPKQHPYWFRGNATAGDVAYFREGLWDSSEYYEPALLSRQTILGFSGGFTTWNNGENNRSITMKAYPGETPQFGSGADSPIKQFIWRNSSTTNYFQYWTFSNLTFNTHKCIMGVDSGNATSRHDDHIRFIGNDGTAPRTAEGFSGMGLTFYGNTSYIYILGNYLHNFGQGAGVLYDAPVIYLSGSISGGTTNNYIHFGWNEFYNNDGKAIQCFAHNGNDTLNHCYIYNNLLDTNVSGGSFGIAFGGDANNTPTGPYSFVDNAYVYNNIFTNLVGSAMRVPDDTMGGHGGNFYVYNNTLYRVNYDGGDVVTSTVPDLLEYKNNLLYASGSSSYTDGAFSNASGDHNLWYGHGAGPDWSTTGDLDNTDPLFTDSTPETVAEIFPTASSPTINAGTALTYAAPWDTYDFYGVARGDTWDIGAFEYSAESGSPSTPSIRSGSIRNGGLRP